MTPPRNTPLLSFFVVTPSSVTSRYEYDSLLDRNTFAVKFCPRGELWRTVRFGVEYFIFATQRSGKEEEKPIEAYLSPGGAIPDILVSSICLPRRTDARILHAPSPPAPAPKSSVLHYSITPYSNSFSPLFLTQLNVDAYPIS